MRGESMKGSQGANFTRGQTAHELLGTDVRAKKIGAKRPLLFALLDRSSAVSHKVPAKVVAMAPKRVQEAMRVVEDYVEGRDAAGRGE
jgi:hypothetical protein